MQTVYVLKSIPAAGKSSYCRELMEQEPTRYKRINNDDLRSAFDFGIYSPENEKIIRKTRDLLLKEFLVAGYDVLHDNVNAGAKNYDEIVKVVKELNLDITVKEVPIFVELAEAIERDSKREGKAKVGEEVIKKFWKQLGGNSFKSYVPRSDVFRKKNVVPVIQNKSLSKCLICDLDGSLALFGNRRSAYCAKDCDLIDEINPPVAKTVELYYAAGYNIIFCSGREDQYQPETKRFIEKHLPNMSYQLFMRKSGDFRKDSIIKEEIFRNHIEGKYCVDFILDDRNSVVNFWRSLGLVCFQVAEGDF
jgi:hypothetical protein